MGLMLTMFVPSVWACGDQNQSYVYDEALQREYERERAKQVQIKRIKQILCEHITQACKDRKETL